MNSLNGNRRPGILIIMNKIAYQVQDLSPYPDSIILKRHFVNEMPLILTLIQLLEYGN